MTDVRRKKLAPPQQTSAQNFADWMEQADVDPDLVEDYVRTALDPIEDPDVEDD